MKHLIIPDQDMSKFPQDSQTDYTEEEEQESEDLKTLFMCVGRQAGIHI